MYDLNDIKQDAFAVYLRVYRRHPDLPELDLLRIYKRGIQGRVDNRARQCFPNSYAYVAGVGKLVLDVQDYVQSPSLHQSAPEEILDLVDIAAKLPDELGSVLKLLIRDFVGPPCIEQRRGRRLAGKQRVEPFVAALARRLKLDPSRDLFSELEAAIDIQQKERGNQ